MKKICCSMYNMADDGENIWFWAYRENLLCKMDKNSLSVTPVIRLRRKNDLSTFDWGEYREIYYIDNNIYLIPMGHNVVKNINLNDNSIKDIEIPTDSEKEGFTQFTSAIAIKDELILMPCEKNTIYKICTKENNKVSPIFMDDKKIMIWGSAICDNSNIYFTSLNDNCVHKFDTEKNEMNKIILLNEKSLSGILRTSNNMWVFPKKTDKIYIFHDGDDKPIVLNDFPIGYISGEWSFYKQVVLDNSICLLPRDSNMVLLVDLKDYSIKGIDISNIVNRKSFIGRYMPFSYVLQLGEDIVCIEAENGKLINLYGKSKYDFIIDGKPLIEEFEDNHGEIVLEENTYYGGLNAFIEGISKL